MRRIKLTESQVLYLKERLNEIQLNGDEALENNNGDLNAAAKEVTQSASEDGINANAGNSVSFSQDALRKHGKAVYESFTKRQLKEARLNNLIRNSKCYRKKNFK